MKRYIRIYASNKEEVVNDLLPLLVSKVYDGYEAEKLDKIIVEHMDKNYSSDWKKLIEVKPEDFNVLEDNLVCETLEVTQEGVIDFDLPLFIAEIDG